jgi:hypothetical protein
MTWVYAVSDGQFVKFGITSNRKRRLQALRNGNPRTLRMVALTHERARDLECVIHQALHRDRIVHTEWFRHSPDVDAIVMILRDKTRGRLRTWLQSTCQPLAACMAPTRPQTAAQREAHRRRRWAAIERWRARTPDASESGAP